MFTRNNFSKIFPDQNSPYIRNIFQVITEVFAKFFRIFCNTFFSILLNRLFLPFLSKFQKTTVKFF